MVRGQSAWLITTGSGAAEPGREALEAHTRKPWEQPRVERDSSEIARCCKFLGQKINRLFVKRPLDVVIMLDGGVWFGLEVLKYVKNVRVHFAKAQSYRGTEPGPLRWVLIPQVTPDVVFDDIADTGETVRAIKQLWPTCKVCTLFKRYNCKYPPDLYGFEVQHDYFLVGFGLDWHGTLRNLSSVYYIQEESDGS